MPVLRAEPLNWASFGVRILSDDVELTQLKISAIKGKGSFHLDGEEFLVEPKGFFQSDATLMKGSTVVAKSRKTSTFKRRFEISSAGHHLTLASSGWLGKEYLLRLGNQEVGRVKREGFAGRKLLLEFPEDVPLFLQVFLTYVVLSQARKEAAAAASG